MPIVKVDEPGENIRDFEVPFITDHESNDEGGMSKEIEDALPELAKTAREFLAKRKPIYDFKTKNKSFVKMYKTLKTLGVQNNKFFLKLYDPDLIGMSPYQAIVPPDLQLKMILECIINPWYWLREFCRIASEGTSIEPGGGVPFELDRNNLASWYCFINRIPHYDVKPRQRGKTQNNVAQFNYAFHFGAQASNFLLFGKDEGNAKDNLARLKAQRDMLPEWAQMRMLETSDGKVIKGSNNTKSITNPINNNKISIMPRATSRSEADKIGRGATAAFQFYDEFDWMPFNDVVYNAAAFAYSRASENAMKNGSMSIKSFASTPADPESRDGRTAKKMMDNMLKWTESMFDASRTQLFKMLNTYPCNGIVYIEHTWRQLGCSMKWYENECKSVSYNQEVILREIDLQRIVSSSQSPFERDDLLYLSQNIKEPIDSRDYLKIYSPINIYEKINRKIPYIIAVDTAEGLSLDNNAMTVINPYTACGVAEFQCNYITQTDVGEMIIKFMDEFCPQALIVVEANKGRELINFLLRSKYRYQVWYDDGKLTAKVIDVTDRYGLLKQKAAERRAYGFDTTKSSRQVLFEILEEYVRNRKDKIFMKYIVKDIQTLIRKTNGRIEASQDNHDDNVMSYMIGLCVLINADNLHEWDIDRFAEGPLDPNKELTEDEKMSIFMSMLPSLPEDLQEMILNVSNTKSEAQRVNEYYAQIQRSQKTAAYDDDSRFITNDDIDAREAMLEQSIWDNNFSVDTTVNIEDYI